MLGGLETLQAAGGIRVFRERALILTAALESLLIKSPYYVPVEEAGKHTKPGFTIITPREAERRGAQWRLDYDGPSDELGKINFIVTKGEQGEIDIERREITPMPEHLSRLFEEEGDAQVPDEHGGEEKGEESQF